MADLASVAMLEEYLGETDDGTFEALLNRVEAALEAACGRTDRPFTAALEEDAEITETHDGTGTSTLYLRYPVMAISAIAIGEIPSAPAETLDPEDAAVVSWVEGSRKVVRRNGYWSWPQCSRVIHVTYAHAGDLPDEAVQAVLVEAARIWRQRGGEDVTAESIGGYRSDLAAGTSETWAMAVAAQGGAL
jgi:hypothetical protein